MRTEPEYQVPQETRYWEQEEEKARARLKKCEEQVKLRREMDAAMLRANTPE